MTQTLDHPPDVGRGLYGPSEMAAYVALFADDAQADAPRVRRWLATALTVAPHRRYRPDHSFLDLVSLFVVDALAEAGVRPSDIRRAEAWLQEQLGVARPFASEEIFTDGRDVLLQGAPVIERQMTAANLRGQEVMRLTIEQRLREVDYREGLAALWRPAGFDCIVLSPDVLFGAPRIDGTRIPTSLIAEQTKAEVRAEQLADWYHLSGKDVDEALAFEDRLALLHRR